MKLLKLEMIVWKEREKRIFERYNHIKTYPVTADN